MPPWPEGSPPARARAQAETSGRQTRQRPQLNEARYARDLRASYRRHQPCSAARLRSSTASASPTSVPSVTGVESEGTRPTADGSFSPVPVLTMQTDSPGEMTPAARAAETPANAAADAGSTNRPDARATQPIAARMSSSGTATSARCDAPTAARAFQALRGRPTLRPSAIECGGAV